ncbi:MAG: hypothetical protein ACK40G_10825 [Cytophagaceae bacterium]
MLKYRLFKALLLVFVVTFSNAQHREIEYSGFFDSYYYRGPLSFTAGIGMAAYHGDVCKLFDCNKFGPAFSLGANYKIWPRVMFGAEFTYFRLKGEETIHPNRYLGFSSTNMELDAYARFYLIDDIVRNARDRNRPAATFKAFILAGAGINRFTASSFSIAKDTIPTDSLFYVPEGAGAFGYAPVFPVGFGLSFTITQRTTLIIDAAYRFTLSDQLDAVSLRGNPGNRDKYIIMNVKVQYSPTMPARKKKKSLPPPTQYDGPKGTDTWKNRPKEKPRRNTYDDYDDQQQEQQQEENQEQEQQQEEKKEQKQDDGWGW